MHTLLASRQCDNRAAQEEGGEVGISPPRPLEAYLDAIRPTKTCCSVDDQTEAVGLKAVGVGMCL